MFNWPYSGFHTGSGSYMQKCRGFQQTFEEYRIKILPKKKYMVFGTLAIDGWVVKLEQRGASEWTCFLHVAVTKYNDEPNMQSLVILIWCIARRKPV